jgi:DNA end-binding protein Ku
MLTGGFMKASWNGYLSLGKLTLPVRLYSATRSITPHFVQLHAKDHSPIMRITKCQKENQEIDTDEIIRAVKRDGKYIEITDIDLKNARPNAQNVMVRQFSDPHAIHPMYYERPYYIVPDKGGELLYTLLREAFVRTNKVAIVDYVLYEKEHIGIISAHGGMLMLEQLRFAAEIIPRAEIETPSLPQPTPIQVDMATQLMDRYSAPFYVEDHRNEQAKAIQEMIDRKAKGLPPKRQKTVAPHTTPEAQVMDALKSLLKNQAPQHLIDA